MSRIPRIHEKLKSLGPTHVYIEDESHLHRGNGVETHLRVVVVAPGFSGLSRVERQRRVQNLVADEFAQGLHALSLRTLTPDEWEAEGAQDRFGSPECQHRRQR